MTRISSNTLVDRWNSFWTGHQNPPEAPPELAAAYPQATESARAATLEALGGRKRLLLVAEDPAQRSFLETLLDDGTNKWVLLPTAKTGAPLVQLVREQQADAVIVLFQAGQTQVLDALQTLARESPDVQRLVLVTEGDRRALLPLKGIPPMTFPRDVTREELEDRLTRAFVVRQWLSRPEMRLILPRIQAIPTLPASFQRALDTLLDPKHSVDQVARIIALDSALTAHILKVANSALFGHMASVSSVTEAVILLGVNRIQALILSAHGFSFVDDDACPGFHPQQESEHALAVAQAAEQLARTFKADNRLAEMAFTAGVLHDFGKVLLAANLPERYGPVLIETQGRGLDLHAAERDHLGTSHAELGACLLGVWGLSLPILESVAWHHEPSNAPEAGVTPLTFVHVADCRIRGRPSDAAYLDSIGARGLLDLAVSPSDL